MKSDAADRLTDSASMLDLLPITMVAFFFKI